VTRATVERMSARGGSWRWFRAALLHHRVMTHNQKENPLYEHFDRLLEIVKPYDAVLSLATASARGVWPTPRPAQIHELIVLGELTSGPGRRGCR